MKDKNKDYRKAGLIGILVPVGIFLMPIILVAALFSKGEIILHLPKIIGPYFLPVLIVVWILAPVFGRREKDGVTNGFVLSLIASSIGLLGAILYASWNLGGSIIDFKNPREAVIGVAFWLVTVSFPAWIGGLFFSGVCQKINQK